LKSSIVICYNVNKLTYLLTYLQITEKQLFKTAYFQSTAQLLITGPDVSVIGGGLSVTQILFNLVCQVLILCCITVRLFLCVLGWTVL